MQQLPSHYTVLVAGRGPLSLGGGLKQWVFVSHVFWEPEVRDELASGCGFC